MSEPVPTGFTAEDEERLLKALRAERANRKAADRRIKELEAALDDLLAGESGSLGDALREARARAEAAEAAAESWRKAHREQTQQTRRWRDRAAATTKKEIRA